jgi:REP element-mobilizing transposase RayT
VKYYVGRLSDPADPKSVAHVCRVSDPAGFVHVAHVGRVSDPASPKHAASERRPTKDQKRPPRRLRRLSEIHRSDKAPLFFLTICIRNRRPLLEDKEVHQIWLSFTSASTARLNVHVGRYVFMPDHIHVFVSCEDSKVLSAWVKALKGTLSRHFRNAQVPGPFWQKGFFDHLLRSGESYQNKWDYVVQNPVRAGLVARSEDWLYAGEIENLE